MLSFKEDAFDAKIVSHTYADKGKIIFDKPITTIREFPFNIPVNLKSITIPDSVTTIDEGTFSGYSSLKEFKGKFASDDGCCLIINGVLNSFASGCDATDYVIPNSVISIGECAFSNCTILANVTIHNRVTTIGEGAFMLCDNLISVRIGDSVTTIGSYAFYGCISLTSVIIPDSVTTIGNYAFANCDSLTSVTIPNSVTTIGVSAFSGCSSLTSVIIPNSVTTIGETAFAGCSNLKEFKGKYASDDGRCLIIDGVLNSFACAELTEYAILDTVITIGSGAFIDCNSLTMVTIGDNVTTIGDSAFYGCI